MANQAEKSGDSPPAEAPSETPAEARSGRKRGSDPQLRSLGSLERLRDRIEVAAHELKRLREENDALSRRIRELEAKPAFGSGDVVVALDYDPEILRRKVGGFIEAIDRFLERERNRT